MSMKTLAHGLGQIFLDKVTLTGGDNIPATGPTLFLGLHRNGAFDGIPYEMAIPVPLTHTFSVQLHGTWLMRRILKGITIKRAQDAGNPDHNTASMADIKTALKAGGRVFLYPEGTSTLGPAPLAFKKGVSHLVADCWRDGIPLKVVPMGVRYNFPTEFRPEAHVSAGPALTVDDMVATDVAAVHAAIEARLTAEAVIAEDEIAQRAMQAVASVRARHAPYLAALRAARALPDALQYRVQDLITSADALGLSFHRGFPAASKQPATLLTLRALCLSVPVALGFIANLVPVLVTKWATDRFADGRNVINVWRTIVGTAALSLWAPAAFVGATLTATLAAGALYVAATISGLKAYTAWHKHVGALWNRLKAPDLHNEVLALREALEA